MPAETWIFNDVIEFIQTKKMELLMLSQRMSKNPSFKNQTERINSVVEVYDEIILDLEKEFINKDKQLNIKLPIIADDKMNVDGRDDSKVSGEQSYELSYLEEKLGVTREQVREAIERVGNDREKVEEYLNKSTDKS